MRTMEAVSQALERGSGLTRQLLAFARREPLKLERIDTTQALESAHGLIRSSIKDHIRFEMQITPGLWAVKADRNQLEVALLNLAVNARDAMPEGGDLLMQAENIVGDDQEKCVAISVADNGEGMSEDTLARAFEPFFSTKAAGHGTGLGLAQVYGFATQCGGKVNIDSAVGQGTTVTITLPRA
ncbi:MAG: ATP-binding protein [Caulobacteraceae bacterium]|nr:ATP-binding protein [Caulobacteraceae bacterium]